MSDDPIEHALGAGMTGVAGLGRVAEILIRHAQEAKARRAAELRQDAEELQRQLNERANLAHGWYRQAAQSTWFEHASAEEIARVVTGVHEWAEVLPERFGEAAAATRARLKAIYGLDLAEAWQDQRNAEALGEYARAGVETLVRVKELAGVDLTARGQDQRNAEAEAEYARAGVEAARAPVSDVSSEQAAGATVAGEAASDREVSVGFDAVPDGPAYDDPEARAGRAAAFAAAGAEGAALRARVVSDNLNAHDPRQTAAATAGRAAGEWRSAHGRRRSTATEGGR